MKQFLYLVLTLSFCSCKGQEVVVWDKYIQKKHIQPKISYIMEALTKAPACKTPNWITALKEKWAIMENNNFISNKTLLKCITST